MKILELAVGKPKLIVLARLVQLVILLAGLFLLGPRFGIAGVALAVNVMLLTGIGIMLWMVRAFVDFSPLRLFGVPSIALSLSILLGRASIELPGICGAYWRTGLTKAIVFSTIYLTIWLVLERSQAIEMFQTIIGHSSLSSRVNIGD